MYFLHVFQNKQGYQNDGHVMFLSTRSDVIESRNTSCVLLLNFLFVVLELPVCLQRRGLVLQRAVGWVSYIPGSCVYVPPSVCTACENSTMYYGPLAPCVSLHLLPSFNNFYLYCRLIPIPAACLLLPAPAASSVLLPLQGHVCKGERGTGTSTSMLLY